MSIYENPLYLICGNINHVQKIENLKIISILILVHIIK